MVSSLIVGIAVARYLGPESYGIITFAMAVYAVAVIITTLGIDDILYRDIVNCKENRGKIEGTALFIKFIVSFFIYAIVLIYSIFSYSGDKLYVILIINFALLFQPFSVFGLVFLAFAEAKYTSTARIISYGISSIFKVILIIIKADIIYFALAVFLDYFILYITITFIYRLKKYNKAKLYIDYMYLKNILKSAPLLLLNILLYTIFLKYNTLYISHYYGDYSAGIYNAALRLTEAFYLIPPVIINAFFPAIIKAKNNGEKEYIKRLEILFSSFMLPFIFISLLITLTAPFIISLLYGQNYSSSSNVLALTIWSVPFIFFYTITSKYFIIENKVFHIFIRSFTALLSLLIFNLIFTSSYGILGAAFSFTLSSITAFYLIDIFFKESRNIFIIKTKSIFIPFIYILNLLKK